VNRTDKKSVVEKLRADIEPDGHLILADYRGLTVEELTGVRAKVRAASGTMRVIKNTLVRRAVDGTDKEAVNDLLEGPNAFVFTKDDPVPVVKALSDAAKDFEALSLKGGVVEGRPVTPEEIMKIAQLPSREVLLGKALGSISSPLQGLVNVCQGTLRNLVYALEAIRQAKAEA
jgi:large subunit ribosomal protein L10